MAELLERPWVRRTIALAVAVAVVGGGYAAYADRASGPHGYRTAVATRGDVEQTLALSGTVAPLGRSDLAFATSGTLASVVPTGARVHKGQIVARLERDSLKRAVVQARAGLDSADAQLARDRQSRSDQIAAVASAEAAAAKAKKEAAEAKRRAGDQAPGSTVSMPACAGTSARTGAAGARTHGSAPGSDASSGCLAAVQRACTSGTTTGGAPTDPAGTAADRADAPTGRPTPSTGPSRPSTGQSSGVPSSGPSTMPPTGPSSTSPGGDQASSSAACTRALAQLQRYVAALTSELQAAQQETGQTSGQPADHTTGQTTGETGEPGAQEGGHAQDQTSGQIPAVTVTTAVLARDRASIVQDKATVVDAKAALRGATVRAPATGRVAEVDVTAGSSVSAGSVALTVIAPGLTTIQIDATSTQIAQLKVGQRASVVPAGRMGGLAGTVTRIGEMPDTSGEVSTYPVVVTLTRSNLSLLTGASASVEVIVGRAHDVVTVPTSAVSGGTVTVLSDGTPQTVRVTTGLVGPTATQVTGGVNAGQTVVLADLATPLPTDGSTQTRGFGGGFGGGGALGGGFGGGAGFGGGPRAARFGG